MQNKDGVITFAQVFVDQSLRSPDARQRVFPTNGCEYDSAGIAVNLIEMDNFLPKELSLIPKASRRTNKNPIFDELARH